MVLPLSSSTVMVSPLTLPVAALLSQVSTPWHAIIVEAIDPNVISSPSIWPCPLRRLQPSLPEKVPSFWMSRLGFPEAVEP